MSKIEWTDETWNPISGCSPVSEGCERCYAKRQAHRIVAMEKGRLAKNPDTKLSGYPHGDPFRVTFHPDRLDAPLHWRKPRRVFVCSMGDLFHPAVNGKQLNQIWLRMFNTPQHQYQILTKRPERLASWTWTAAKIKHWPINEIWPPHIWLGVSVENNANRWRIDELLKIPAAVRFVSVEPMLEGIDFTYGYDLTCDADDLPDKPAPSLLNKLNWVICGGESGPGRRPFNLDHARELRDQCKAAGVPFFMKQVDKRQPIPDDLMIREYPR